MRPVKVTSAAATGVTAPVVIDQYLNPSTILLVIEFGSAVATCTVQYSADDPFATYATDYNTNAVWLDHPTLAAQTADSADNISVPVRAVRLNTTAWTSGQPTLTVIQAGSHS